MKGEGHDIHIILSFLADLITAVEFDPTGNYLATGDRSGRVVLFERNDDVSKKCQYQKRRNDHSKRLKLDTRMRIQVPYRVPVA